MKKLLMATIALCFFTGNGFAQKKQPSWPEMKIFHTYMSTTFHPAEEGDLKPIKSKADSLLAAATNWNNSAIPVNYKPAETKKQLTKLVEQCTAVRDAVNNKLDDNTIIKLLSDAHDIFHTIVGECRKADD